ncbi:uncharacterized protein LOC142481350 [Ascaphus truei]|uniref:uncharacterized protein LOC142481350 n=1 Tax=Ascaphus truei TaxID=8439 RepID=UPI003F59C1C4
MDTEYYKGEAERILSDDITYARLKTNPHKEFCIEFLTLLDKGSTTGVLNEKEYDYLNIKFPVMPIFYFLPKIHKDIKAPPGRPIISGIGSLTLRLSEYIDGFLQPYVAEMRSYLRDTTQILNVLEQVIWQDDYKICTCDVTSLYTSIKHDDGIEAINRTLTKDPTVKIEQRRFILESINFILKHNLFKFDGTYFLQKCGTAMGTKFAPSYANLFMDNWETDTIWSEHEFGADLVLWRRYIDDVFFIWKGSSENLNHFLNYINTNERNLAFTTCIGNNTVDFLDLTIYIEDTKLKTKTFFKKVDCNNYLLNTSCHHKKWLKNIPPGQFRRIRRNCSDDHIYREQSNILKKRFIAKNYDNDKMDIAIREVGELERIEILKTNPPKPKEEFSIAFLTQFSQDAGSIQQILNKHWHLLLGDPTLKEYLPEKPKVIYKRADNIKRKLAPSLFRMENRTTGQDSNWLQTAKGFHRCNTCKACKQGSKEKIQFSSNTTGEQFKTGSFINCKSEFVVYLLNCPCGLQYVGRTSRPLRVRILEHLGNIRRKLMTHSVSKHFALHHQGDPSGLEFRGIEVVPPHWRGGDRLTSLSRKETFWIYKLKSLVPTGLNVEIDIAAFL